MVEPVHCPRSVSAVQVFFVPECLDVAGDTTVFAASADGGERRGAGGGAGGTGAFTAPGMKGAGGAGGTGEAFRAPNERGA